MEHEPSYQDSDYTDYAFEIEDTPIGIGGRLTVTFAKNEDDTLRAYGVLVMDNTKGDELFTHEFPIPLDQANELVGRNKKEACGQ